MNLLPARTTICYLLFVLTVLVLLVAGQPGTSYANGAAAGSATELTLQTQELVSGRPDHSNVLVAFSRQPGPTEEALVRNAGGEIKYSYHLIPAIAASVPTAALAGLRQNPRVIRIDPDLQVQIADTELDNVWGVKRIGAGVVHGSGNRGAGIRVGILDTGIDTDHPDLAYDPACSASFVDGEPTVEDGHSHGTHTAGIVAALDDNAGVVGVAPEVTLCIYKVFDSSGNSNYSDIAAAIERAVDDGVQVTSNSYGGIEDPGPTIKAAFDNAYAAGVLHVGSAGNNGTFLGVAENCIYPALWSSVIAVTAITEDDTLDLLSSSCSQAELAAPGTQIYSTIPGGYGTKSGTSMAAPHVAGTAALVLAANAGWSNGMVRLQLQTTAEDLGDPGRDGLYGYGLVDADGAAPAMSNNPPVAGDDDFTATPVLEGGSLGNLDVLANDGDADGTLDVTSVTITAAINGTVTVNADGSVDFIHDGSETTSATFTYTVADDQGAISNEAIAILAVTAVNDPPTVAFAYDCSYLICDFDASAAYDPDGSIASYLWDFGDGNIDSGPITSHTFATAGTYSITLALADDRGATSDSAQSVVVTEAPAVHVGDLDGASLNNGKTWEAQVIISIHSSGHAPVAGATVFGTWSDGTSGASSCTTGADGTCAVAANTIPKKSDAAVFTINSVESATAIYNAPANHDPDADSSGVAIQVNKDGTTAVPDAPVNQPPVASFTYSCSGWTCTFVAAGSADADGTIVAYAWSFGDQTSATGPTAEHTYTRAGVHTVRLTVTDDDGAEASASQDVSVEVATGTIFVFDLAVTGKSAGPRQSARATVTIHDLEGNPVSGATVSGAWSGDYTATVTGITVDDGTVSFSSGKLRQATATFTFAVTDVTHPSFTYDPALDNQSAVTIVVP